jgi:hypothetical protein
MIDETLQNLLFAMILLSAFTGALAFAEPVRIDLDTQPLCLLILSTGEYDCSWTLVMWHEGQYLEMVAYRALSASIDSPEKVFQKYSGGAHQLAGFYTPEYHGNYSNQVHIYLPTDDTADPWGYKTTTHHEVYGHAFNYVNYMDDIFNGKADGRNCPCNFHG